MSVIRKSTFCRSTIWSFQNTVVPIFNVTLQKLQVDSEILSFCWKEMFLLDFFSFCRRCVRPFTTIFLLPNLLESFSVWYSIKPFGIFFGHLVYFPRLGMFGPRKIWQPLQKVHSFRCWDKNVWYENTGEKKSGFVYLHLHKIPFDI
jgi:hypothetical protein